jgi:hypothetical protein
MSALARQLDRAVRLGFLHPAVAWVVLVDASRKAPQ